MLPFKITGAALILFSVVIAALISLNRATAARGGRDLMVLWPLAAAFVVLGVGLLRQSRISAILFVLLSGAFSAWLIIGSLIYVPFPWSLLNVFFGFLVFLPSVSFYKQRSRLVK